MVKVIGIFVIVFVYYCEINAELVNLQHRKTATADVRRIFNSKKKFAGNKTGGLLLRSNAVQPHAKFTTGFREDIRDPHKEYVLRNGEARNNVLEHLAVKKRRFKRNYRDEENKQIDAHDSESNKPKKRRHHHSRRKMNKYKNSTRNKKTKPYKNEDRNVKVKKLNKEKNRREKRNRDKNHSKYSEHPKDMGMSHKREKHHINQKKPSADKSKDKQREKSIDRNKHATTGGPMRISKMGIYSIANENDHRHNKKQLINRSNDKQREKSKHNKDANKTAIGLLRLGAAGFAALVGKSLASIKDSKPEQVLTSTTTPKPPPELVQEHEVLREKKLIKRERLNLRTKEKIRVTRMIPFSLNKENDAMKKQFKHNITSFREIHKLSQKSEKERVSESPPSILSPYAITAQMELLMKEFPNVNATVGKAGRTIEYNDIVLVSVTEKKQDDTYFRVKESKYIDEVPEKKIIFIVHGLTVMGLKDLTSLVKISELKLLLSYYFKHLDKFDFFLMPLANPDGYSASLSSDRTMWNKNVSPQSVCPGVFVDRNFDVAWNYTNQDMSSCSQLYPGDIPFSEVESKAVRDIFHRYGHKILAYIHVHAGTFDEKVFKGEAILYPRGYTKTQSDDDKYIDIKGEVDEAMKNASFRVMSVTVDPLSNWYGVVSGTSVDYAATVYGIPYAMEFVMQLYDSESLNNSALTEIWSRLIDATFNNMWKSLQGGNDARRFGQCTHTQPFGYDS